MKLTRSIGHAWHGIQYCIKTQVNFRTHLIVLITVMMAGFICKLTGTEWLFVIVCSMLVLSLELLNTAIEQLCDMVTKDFHPSIKIIKDVAAAAVLIVAAGSVLTGIIIFLPKLISLLKFKY